MDPLVLGRKLCPRCKGDNFKSVAVQARELGDHIVCMCGWNGSSLDLVEDTGQPRDVAWTREGSQRIPIPSFDSRACPRCQNANLEAVTRCRNIDTKDLVTELSCICGWKHTHYWGQLKTAAEEANEDFLHSASFSMLMEISHRDLAEGFVRLRAANGKVLLENSPPRRELAERPSLIGEVPSPPARVRIGTSYNAPTYSGICCPGCRGFHFNAMGCNDDDAQDLRLLCGCGWEGWKHEL